MISNVRNHITSKRHIATIPGGAIALAVLALNLLGDYLRHPHDPSSRSHR